MKEINPNNVAVFQDGKLKAFGTLTSYTEEDETFKSTIQIEKGSLLCGEHPMQICKEYNVLTDTNGIWVQ